MDSTPPKTPPRTALYARVSTTGHGQGVGLQLEELRQVARQRGWNVVAEHVDHGVSGATTTATPEAATGRPSSLTAGGVTTSFGWDARGRVVSERTGRTTRAWTYAGALPGR
jgi:YD repeat-containing protein